MVYLARVLHMPTGEQLVSRVVEVSGGRVINVKEFLKEEPSMFFVEDIYIVGSSNVSSANDICKEAHTACEPLFAYAVDKDGRMSQLV